MPLSAHDREQFLAEPRMAPLSVSAGGEPQPDKVQTGDNVMPGLDGETNP